MSRSDARCYRVTASDEEVFCHACSQGLILISCNRDHFARQTRDHPGLMNLVPNAERASRNAPMSRCRPQRAGDLGFSNQRTLLGFLGCAGHTP